MGESVNTTRRSELFIEPGGDPGSGGAASLEAYLAALDAEEEEATAVQRGSNHPELFINTGALLPYGPRGRSAGLWCKDGVHFSKLGSQTLGARIARLIQPLVVKLRTT